MALSSFDNELLKNAVDIFHRTTGLEVKINQKSNQGLVLQIRFQNQELFLDVDVKPNVNQVLLNINKMDSTRKKQLLIIKFVTPSIADQFQKKNIPYIDSAGNAYINQPPLYIHLKGNKLSANKKEPIGRLFRTAGLKVLFALLCNPGLEKESYRKIMKTAYVALGTVEIAMKELQRRGYLIELGKNNRKLVRKKRLLERWVMTYPEQLRPGLVKGYYQTKKQDWWKDIKLVKYNAQWGGEIGAALITNFYRPKIITIYSDKIDNRLLLENKMRRGTPGEVEIVQKFWDFEFDWKFKDIVHPILVYADLMASETPRNVEIAELLYEQELYRFITED